MQQVVLAHRQEEGLKCSVEHCDGTGSGNCLETISVHLLFNKEETYTKGSHIHGRIFFYVPPSADGCHDFSGIHLSLKGLETIELPVGTDRDPNKKNIPLKQYNKKIVAIDNEIIPFSSPLVAGQHEYPFDFQLPETLPCSMFRKSSSNPSTSKIHFNLTPYPKSRTASSTTTTTTTTNLQYPVANQSEPIHIVAGNNGINRAGGVVAESKRFPIKSRFMTRGYVELSLDANKIVVASPSPTITVGVTGRNGSSVPVEKLIIQVKETISWGTKLRRHERQRILADSSVSVSKSPSWQPKAVVAERSVTQLQLNDPRESYKSQMIEVRHTLQVTVVLSNNKPITYTKAMEFYRQPNPIRTAKAQLLMPSDEIVNISSSPGFTTILEAVPVGINSE